MNEIERPDEKVLFVWRAEVLISWGIMLLVTLVVAIIAIVASGVSWLWLGVCVLPVLFAVSSLILARQRWKRWTFQITPHTLEMSHGIWVRHRRVVSRNRIQHVDFNSGPVGRKFDLVHVIVHTAGATVGTIPGVRTERAERLREELMSGPKSL